MASLADGPKWSATPRKHTRFEICDKHSGWFAGTTRARKAETFVEGGPAGQAGCEGRGPCRVWPGTDFYVPEICHGELELDWTLGEPAPLVRVVDIDTRLAEMQAQIDAMNAGSPDDDEPSEDE